MNFNSMKGFFGSDFGRIHDEGIALTANGLGVRTKSSSYAVYDKEKDTITVVPAELTFGEVPVFAFPTNKLEIGDLILHNGFLKYVAGVDKDNGDVLVIHVKTQEVQTIKPAKTMLGYVLASKVFTPFENMKGMFGGDGSGKFDQNALMMMALMGDGGFLGGDDGDGDDTMLMAMMMGGFGGGDASANPMGNMLPMLMMSKFFKG